MKFKIIDKFIKYTEKLEYLTVVFLLRLHNFKERLSNHNLKIYLGLYILILLYFQWYYVNTLLYFSQNSLLLNNNCIVLIIPTILVTVILARILIFIINPKHKRYGKQTLEVKKELSRKYKPSKRKRAGIAAKNKLALREDYSHTDIANELIKIHKNNPDQVKTFIYYYFKTNDYRQKFRTLFKNN